MHDSQEDSHLCWSCGQPQILTKDGDIEEEWVCPHCEAATIKPKKLYDD
jgi:rubrerythrin